MVEDGIYNIDTFFFEGCSQTPILKRRIGLRFVTGTIENTIYDETGKIAKQVSGKYDHEIAGEGEFMIGSIRQTDTDTVLLAPSSKIEILCDIGTGEIYGAKAKKAVFVDNIERYFDNENMFNVELVKDILYGK